jgi:predicted transglutaminase-like cysteine proteinase
MARNKKHRMPLIKRLALSAVATAAFAVPTATLAMGTANAATTSPAATTATSAVASAKPPGDVFIFKDDLSETQSGSYDSTSNVNYGGTQIIWAAMNNAQQKLMQNPAFAQAFNDYMSQFDYLKGKPYGVIAQAVNEKVRKDIKLVIDNPNGNAVWTPPAKTIKSRAGDASDIALVDYSALESVGIPDDQLLFAQMVGSQSMNICVGGTTVGGACKENPKYKNIASAYPDYLQYSNNDIQFNVVFLSGTPVGSSAGTLAYTNDVNGNGNYYMLSYAPYKDMNQDIVSNMAQNGPQNALTLNFGNQPWSWDPLFGVTYALNQEGYWQPFNDPDTGEDLAPSNSNGVSNNILPLTYQQAQQEMQGALRAYVKKMDTETAAYKKMQKDEAASKAPHPSNGSKDAVPNAKDAALIALLGLIGIGVVAGAIKSKEFRTGILCVAFGAAALAGVAGTLGGVVGIPVAIARDFSVHHENQCYYGDDCYNVSPSYVDYMYSGGPVDDGTTAPNPAHAPPGLNNFKGWLPLEIPGAVIADIIVLLALAAALGEHRDNAIDKRRGATPPRTKNSL